MKIDSVFIIHTIKNKTQSKHNQTKHNQTKMQNPVNKEKERFAAYSDQELDYYTTKLPSQTFEFEYVDDAWDYLGFLWSHSKLKGRIQSTSFKAILTGDDNQLVKVTISGIYSHEYNYYYL